MSADDAGLSGRLESLLDKAVAGNRVSNLHCIVVIRNGRTVLERYFDGEDSARGRPLGTVSFRPDTRHDLRSVSKSIVGLLYGVALAAGKVPPPTAPLAPLFPQYADLFTDRVRGRWTLHHVLSMTMGTDWDELSVPYTDPSNSEIGMDRAADRYRFVLDRPVVMEPGKRWTYCGGATALLGRIIANGTGQALHDYARAALFDPLGIGLTDWYLGKDRDPIAASGVRMRPRDLAKIGQLMLFGGVWDGRAVVPADWIALCTSPVVPIDEVRQYGYHWYLGRVSSEAPAASGPSRSRVQRCWSAAGNGGQRLVVFPELDLVLVTLFGNYDKPDQSIAPTTIIRDVVLPAAA